MKNKKGFTLVELLAVIAILAILVIISLPNVIGMFNEAKKNSFVTELRNIYKLAGQQWINDSLFETAERTYSRCETCTGKTLQLSGRQNLDYHVVINKAGEVTKFYATDGTFQYSYIGKLLPTDITDAELVADLTEDDVLHISNNIAYRGSEEPKIVNGEIFIAYGGSVKIGEEIPSDLEYYNSQEEATNVSNRPIFLKHVVRNNVVIESYVGIILDGNTYFIQGGQNLPVNDEQRRNGLNNFFNGSGCFQHGGNNYSCQKGKIYGYVIDGGGASGYDTSSGCYVGCDINSDGSSSCALREIFC